MRPWVIPYGWIGGLLIRRNAYSGGERKAFTCIYCFICVMWGRCGVLGWGLGVGSWDGVLGWGIGMGSWDGVLGGLDGDGHCFDDAFGMCLFGYGGKEGLWMVGVVYGADGCNFVAEDSAGRGRSGFEVGGGYDGYRW